MTVPVAPVGVTVAMSLRVAVQVVDPRGTVVIPLWIEMRTTQSDGSEFGSCDGYEQVFGSGDRHKATARHPPANRKGSDLRASEARAAAVRLVQGAAVATAGADGLVRNVAWRGGERMGLHGHAGQTRSERAA